MSAYATPKSFRPARKSNNSIKGLIVLVLVLIALFSILTLRFPATKAMSDPGANGIDKLCYDTAHLVGKPGWYDVDPLVLHRPHREAHCLPEGIQAGTLPNLNRIVPINEPTEPIVTNTPVVTETHTTVPPVVVTPTPVVVTPEPTQPPVVVTPEPTQPPVVVTPEPTQPPVVITPEPTDDDKKHYNKGEGNGSEGGDPGNHPEKGNDDENGTSNGKKNG